MHARAPSCYTLDFGPDPHCHDSGFDPLALWHQIVRKDSTAVASWVTVVFWIAAASN